MVTVEELGEEIASLSAHLDAGTHRLLECIRRFDEGGGWFEQGAVSCAHWLAWRVGLDPATAREKVRVARALGKLPAIDEALRVARLSYAKVRALTRVATPENEAKLLELALVATGAQLERLCRGYRTALSADREIEPEERSVRQRLLPGGMVKLELVLSPDEADLLLRSIDRAREVHAEAAKEREAEPAGVSAEAPGSAEARERDGQHGGVSAEASWPSRADGAVKLAEAFLAGHRVTGAGGERFQVMVHLDQDVLGPDGSFAGTLEDGTHLSVEALRRVACDCGLVALGHGGERLDIGRRTRSIPPAIRRALMLRDRGCAFPGCTHTRFLHGHHVRHWLHGGETSVGNLILLCTAHHRMVHEGGWRVTAGEDGAFAFCSPAGKPVAAPAAHVVTENVLTWLREWADEHDVSLGPDANEPQWDGTKPDYDWAVSVLCS